MAFSDDENLIKFLGRGLPFPITLTNGKADLIYGPELVKSDIRILLSWQYGTKFYLYDFGSKIEQLLYEPNTVVLKNLLNQYVIDPINKWEKRINLVDSAIITVTHEKIMIKLTYRFINSNIEDSFIVPFYRTINT